MKRLRRHRHDLGDGGVDRERIRSLTACNGERGSSRASTSRLRPTPTPRFHRRDPEAIFRSRAFGQLRHPRQQRPKLSGAGLDRHPRRAVEAMTPASRLWRRHPSGRRQRHGTAATHDTLDYSYPRHPGRQPERRLRAGRVGKRDRHDQQRRERDRRLRRRHDHRHDRCQHADRRERQRPAPRQCRQRHHPRGPGNRRRDFRGAAGQLFDRDRRRLRSDRRQPAEHDGNDGTDTVVGSKPRVQERRPGFDILADRAGPRRRRRPRSSAGPVAGTVSTGTRWRPRRDRMGRPWDGFLTSSQP